MRQELARVSGYRGTRPKGHRPSGLPKTKRGRTSAGSSGESGLVGCGRNESALIDGEELLLDDTADGLLEGFQGLEVPLSDESKGGARLASSTGATDAMNVLFHRLRRVV